MRNKNNTQHYIQLKITVTPNTEVNRDVISGLLVTIGFESFIESEEGLNAYVNEKFYAEEAVADVLNHLPLPSVSIRYQTEWVQSRDWNEEWEKNFFQPIIIADQVVIHSSFHKDIPQLPYDIVIDPKMAFGTGHHSTTALMVSYLLEQDLNGKSFLDMGCGTAVLAIMAQKKGAQPVVAIDNDEWAYENALENIRLNNASAIRVRLGDAKLLGKERYDCIFANINRNILLTDIPVYAACLFSGSSLFMSGFYTEDIEIISAACREQSLEFVGYKEDNHWGAVHFIRK
jgi:ribosomal protein L11 methyltransferase